MSSEEDIPELAKLEITAHLPQVKLSSKPLPLALNPFYIECIACDEEVSPALSSGAQLSKSCPTTGSKTRTRHYYDSTWISIKNDTCAADTLPGVQRGAIKKNSTSGNKRKFVLREPVLQALQTCLQPQSSARKRFPQSPENERTISVSSTGAPDETLGSGRGGINDFRDLVEECQTLLEQEVTLCTRIGSNVSPRTSKSFNTIQNKHLASNVQAQLPPPLSITPCSSTPSPEHSISSRASTSCSQQAGNSAASVCDDVTIDELASYFDTLVHIPKKMSSMAEMMYI